MNEQEFGTLFSEIDYNWDGNNNTNDIGELINGTDGNRTGEVQTELVHNWWALIAIVLVVCTAAGNVLVCLAIYLERRLQNVTNYFLMSLAITDLLVAILVMPVGILTLVREPILLVTKMYTESERLDISTTKPDFLIPRLIVNAR
ncbi:jg13024 [Pararge aegeria aegeria]|uniref:Jg13024 protein n=1 Tax=Pararge aegeria aegeria TaxID=348720 RepID=A0A8S4RML1_9NEOP|nr:jg13024 [Pararge aegeria aegeria]